MTLRLLFGLCMALWCTLAPALANTIPLPQARPFLMGFTRWPSDFTLESVAMTQAFAETHGDIVSVMMIGGIPWPEAASGAAFSQDVTNTLAYRPPAGKKLLLSISPLSSDRKNLAPYWGEKDNLPLPSPWNGMSLNNPQVKRAYLNFVLRAAAAMSPDYLAIGIESNILLSHDAAKWAQFKDLYRETYAGVKAQYPALPVFFTTDVLHYKKLADEAKGSDQEGQVAELMRYSDLFAMSVYPHMSLETPRPLPADFFDFANGFGKPVAVSEGGMNSQDVTLEAFHATLDGSPAGQQQFIALMLDSAARNRYAFVINYATTDFVPLCDKLPSSAQDVCMVWAYSGMQTSDGKPKPALAVWDTYFNMPYGRD